MSLFKVKSFRFFIKIKNLLDLKTDLDIDGTYALVSNAVDFRSGNAWGLIFAIFIASIGLNVNSTAVIIGAMLISPLMGPIVGAGFSLGTHDFALLKRSLKNLTYAVGISIFTSALFFLISPSGVMRSELLARTQPTFFDVLIAFFGGAAGIVASTRIVKGNAVPGVAIATALMPPLCTVGYSVAHLEFQYAVGALYLFSINTIFILISTYLFTRILGFKVKVDRSSKRDRIIHRYMTWGSIVFILPSVFMAWYLHKKSQFENELDLFFNNEFNLPSTVIAKKEIVFNLNETKITLFLFGDELSQEQKMTIMKVKEKYPALQKSKLIINSIQRDGFSINDLEERFVRRSEFSQLLKIEEGTKSFHQQLKSPEIVKHLNELFENQLRDVDISENRIQIFWKKKPSKVKMDQAELKILGLMMGQEFSFTHSVLLR